MSTTAQLLVKVTSEGLIEVNGGLAEFVRLSKAAENANKSVASANKIETASRIAEAREIKADAVARRGVIDATTAEIRQRKELANAISAESRMRQTLIREQRQEQSGLRTSGGLVGALRQQVLGLGAAYVSVQGSVRLFNSTIETVASYQTLERQLEFLTGGGAQAAAKELQYLTNTSQKYGTVLLESTQSYAALASAMQMSGVSMKGVHQTYEALSAISATFALRQDQVNAIMLAFTQIAGKGRVQSEELVRQLGQYLPALQLGAQAMGMSISEFNKALKAGTVASSEFIPKFSELANTIYGSNMERKTDTITAAINRLKTAWQEFLNTGATGSGFASVFMDVINAASTVLNLASGNNPNKFIEDYAASAVEAKDRIGELKRGVSSLYDIWSRGPANILWITEIPDKVHSIGDAWNAVFNSEKLATEKLEEFRARASLLSSDQTRIGIAAIKARAEASGELTYGAFDSSTGKRSETWNTESELYQELLILNEEYHKRIAEQDKSAEQERLKLIGNLEGKIVSETDAFLDERVKANLSASSRVILAYQQQIKAVEGYIESLKKQKAPLQDIVEMEAKLAELRNGQKTEIVSGITSQLTELPTNEIDKINQKYDQLISDYQASKNIAQGDNTLGIPSLFTEDDLNVLEKISTARNKALDDYRDKQHETLTQMTEEARVSTLDEESQILAKYQWKIQAAEKAYGDDKEGLENYQKWVWAQYDADVVRFRKSEDDKTKELTSQLLKRYGKYTPEGVKAQYSEQRTAASKITDPTQRAAVEAGIDVAERKAQTQAIIDSTNNQFEILNSQRENDLISREKYNSAIAKLDEDFLTNMNQTAEGQNQIYQAKLGMYGNLINQASGIAGQLQSLAGENTGFAKTMFLTSKALAIAGAIVNTNLAATQVMADPTALTAAQKISYSNMIRMMGYTSAALIAAQTVASVAGGSYATGGYTGPGGKYEPRGTVHAGEVVFSQEDVRRNGGVAAVEAYRKGYAEGGYVAPYSAPTPTITNNSTTNGITKIVVNNTVSNMANARVSVKNGVANMTIEQVAEYIDNDQAWRASNGNGKAANIYRNQFRK